MAYLHFMHLPPTKHYLRFTILTLHSLTPTYALSIYLTHLTLANHLPLHFTHSTTPTHYLLHHYFYHYFTNHTTMHLRLPHVPNLRTCTMAKLFTIYTYLFTNFMHLLYLLYLSYLLTIFYHNLIIYLIYTYLLHSLPTLLNYP
jgi:hypothetical protein